MYNQALGTVIGGSLQEGCTIRLFPQTPLESIRTGTFICLHGEQYRFFSLITDITLITAQPDIVLFPPQPGERLLRETLAIKDTYALAMAKPLVMINQHNQVLPVTTLPGHFTPAFEAQEQDIATIFGDEQDPHHCYFAIGTPIGLTTNLCINLHKITERSVGIFGKTGTGKTFITRLILAGLLSKHAAVCIIFDMHSEYGIQARSEQHNSFVKGLKTLFPHTVALFSLDPHMARRRGVPSDHTIYIDPRSIHVEDIISLQDELNLHPTACEAAYLLAARYGNEWLTTILSSGTKLKELAHSVGAHTESIAALYRKLKPLERFSFIKQSTVDNLEKSEIDIIDNMIDYIDRGISIVIEFGSYTSTLCYLLVANIITRRIHTLYTNKTEQFLTTQKAADRPKQLMIVIEEAHKFLNTTAARQTTFGTIAREMRKYYVSLLIIDQRPSGIDPEVLSQIGTKLIAQLSDDKDIQAVLTGNQHTTYLRTLLSSLSSRQQLLALGHALPLPMLLKTRPYDEKFYTALLNQQISPMASLQDLYPTLDTN